MGEQGETERDVSRVEGALLDSVDGDRGPSKVKFSLNMAANEGVDGRECVLSCHEVQDWLISVRAVPKEQEAIGRWRI